MPKRSLTLSLLCASIVIVAMVILVFVYNYVDAEDPAYVWDWGGYYRIWWDYANPYVHPTFGLHDILHSIKRDDYNPVPILPLLPLYTLGLGTERVRYISGISIEYIIPVAFMTTILIWYSCHRRLRTIYKNIFSSILFITVFISALTFPGIWEPTIRGLPDVSGLIPLTVSLFILFKSRFLLKGSWQEAILFGLMLWSCFLLRRWYAITIVSTLILAFSFCLFLTLKQKRNGKKAILNYSIAGLVMCISALIMQYKLILRIINTDYSQVYAAYQSNFISQIAIYCSRIGQGYTVLFLIGGIYALSTKNLNILFCFLNAILTVCLFSRTQAPGLHHSLPVFLYIFITDTWFVIKVFSVVIKRQNTCRAYLIWFLYLSYSLTCFSCIFIPKAQRLRSHLLVSDSPYINLFPTFREYPIKLENKKGWEELICRLHSALENNGKFAVFADNYYFNDTLICSISHDLCSKSIWVSQIDARDYMPLQFRYADIILAADPYLSSSQGEPEEQTHVSFQQVAPLLSKEIISTNGFRGKYRALGNGIRIQGNQKVYLYKRISYINEIDIQKLEQKIQSFYPDWKWDGKDLIAP